MFVRDFTSVSNVRIKMVAKRDDKPSVIFGYRCASSPKHVSNIPLTIGFVCVCMYVCVYVCMCVCMQGVSFIHFVIFIVVCCVLCMCGSCLYLS